jgi:hypothetical protein
MPPDVVKQKKVTFATSLPMGERGTFTHDGELWIAYRRSKNQRIFSLIDRLIGIHAGITKEMIMWINARPGDAELVARVLERTEWARKAQRELTLEKAEAFTQ